jgi:hypothetical protein
MERPVACSLDELGAQTQLDEWRAVLGALVVSVERVDAQTVRMQLDRDSDRMGALVALAQREAACCPFFQFAIEIDAERTAFTATVPADAATILDAFATLAGS